MELSRWIRMEGFLFYWITWLFWIIAIFFMKRGTKERYFLAISLLLLIISSSNMITILGLQFSASSFVLYFMILLYFAKYESRRNFSLFPSVFIVTIAFACFQIYELFDPVWIIFPRIWMLSILLAALSIFLIEKKSFRIFILIAGALQGDFLYALILQKLSFPYTIGSFAFLDVISLTAVLLIIWNGIEILAEYYAKYYNQSGREKRKLS